MIDKNCLLEGKNACQPFDKIKVDTWKAIKERENFFGFHYCFPFKVNKMLWLVLSCCFVMIVSGSGREFDNNIISIRLKLNVENFQKSKLKVHQEKEELSAAQRR